MAIKITGFFTNPDTEQIFRDPILVLIPHLEAYGKIHLDVNITNLEGNIKGCISYMNIEHLQYDILNNDPYSNLIKTLQKYVIDDLLILEPNLNYEFIK